MTASEKILVIIMAILVVLVIVLGYLHFEHDNIYQDAKQELNKLHEAKIRLYENQQDSLFNIISILQHENDSLNELKQEIKVVTIREVDSVRALPFIDKRVFWSTETARVDSIRARYLSRN